MRGRLGHDARRLVAAAECRRGPGDERSRPAHGEVVEDELRRDVAAELHAGAGRAGRGTRQTSAGSSRGGGGARVVEQGQVADAARPRPMLAQRQVAGQVGPADDERIGGPTAFAGRCPRRRPTSSSPSASSSAVVVGGRGGRGRRRRSTTGAAPAGGSGLRLGRGPRRRRRRAAWRAATAARTPARRSAGPRVEQVEQRAAQLVADDEGLGVARPRPGRAPADRRRPGPAGRRSARPPRRPRRGSPRSSRTPTGPSRSRAQRERMVGSRRLLAVGAQDEDDARTRAPRGS